MSCAVLHVPYTYFPDPCGGTEVYVRGLAQRLAVRGWSSAVAAPANASAHYVNAGLPVWRFEVDPRTRLALAYGLPDEAAAGGFRKVVDEVRPRIVHLHAFTAAVSERLVDIAHEADASVVFTYHTPTASCARGTMMLEGQRPCDGRIEKVRCTACALASRGAPRLLSRVAAHLPTNVLAALAGLSVEAKPLSAVRIPGLIAESQQRFRRFVSKVDHVVAVCQWVRDVLERNGVAGNRITLSQQGIGDCADTPRTTDIARSMHDAAGLKIGYFGRVDHAKGPDLLAGALGLIPDARIQIDIYAVRQAGAAPDIAALEAQAMRDRRLRVLSAIDPDAVIGVMSAYDFIAVPSRWMETGPLVVLEAFAARVPVLGARLGEISELVRDGTDGILIEPDDPRAWARELARLASDMGLTARLRAGISAPRTIDASGADMACLYARLAAVRDARV